MSAKKRTKKNAADPLEADFGPGFSEDPTGAGPSRAGTGPIPGLACAGDGCFLKPAADLLGRFSLRVARGHGPSLARAAFSGIELMKAMRDFLDEEIALAERAAGKGEEASPRYERIRVE